MVAPVFKTVHFRCGCCDFETDKEREMNEHALACSYDPEMEGCGTCANFKVLRAMSNSEDNPIRACTELDVYWHSIDDDELRCNRYNPLEVEVVYETECKGK